jgi:hypothetical protein
MFYVAFNRVTSMLLASDPKSSVREIIPLFDYAISTYR